MPVDPPVDPDTDARGVAASRPLHLQFVPALLVFLGGAVGTAARYGLAQLEPTHPGRWPWGTFVANIVGAFVLGLLLEALQRAGDDVGVRRRLRLLGGTGFCGGFTTYSTFAVESGLLVRDHHAALAVAYLVMTVVAGLVATVIGIGLAARGRRA